MLATVMHMAKGPYLNKRRKNHTVTVLGPQPIYNIWWFICKILCLTFGSKGWATPACRDGEAPSNNNNKDTCNSASEDSSIEWDGTISYSNGQAYLKSAIIALVASGGDENGEDLQHPWRYGTCHISTPSSDANMLSGHLYNLMDRVFASARL